MTKLIKIGGSCLAEHAADSARSVARCLDGDIGFVVHGYGATLRHLLAKLGIERSQFISASGVQSYATDERVVAASLLAATLCGSSLKSELALLGISADNRMAFWNRMCVGKRKDNIRIRQGNTISSYRDDFSCTLSEVNLPENLEQTRIVAPMLIDGNNDLVVMDADKLAMELAVTLKLSSIIILSDVPGLLHGGRYLDYVPMDKLDSVMVEAKGGMRKKLEYIKAALVAGVERLAIYDGRDPESISAGRGTIFGV